MDRLGIAACWAAPYNYAYINRAELHHKQKRLQEALSDCTKAIELSPSMPEPYAERASVYSDLQLPENAARDKEMAEKLRVKGKKE